MIIQNMYYFYIMRNIHILLVLLCICCAFNSLNAQEPAKGKGFKPSGFYFLLSENSGDYNGKGALDFQKLNRGSIPDDFTPTGNSHINFNLWSLPGYRPPGIINLMGGVEFNIPSGKPDLYQSQFRLGFLFNNQNTASSRKYSKTEVLNRTYIDTMYSGATGNIYPIYRDSLRLSLAHAQYSNSLISLDFSYLLRLFPLKTLSFYTGLGCSPGLIFNAVNFIAIYSQTMTQQNFYFPGNYYTYDDHSQNLIEYEFEKIRNQPGVSLGMFIPLGLNVCLGKNKEIWKHLNIFLELRPSLIIQNLPESGTYTNRNFTSSWGAAFRF